MKKYRPSIFKKAAKFIELNTRKEGGHDCACFALSKVNANDHEYKLFAKYYQKDYGYGQFWFGSTLKKANAKKRINALLRMEKVVKRLNNRKINASKTNRT